MRRPDSPPRIPAGRAIAQSGARHGADIDPHDGVRAARAPTRGTGRVGVLKGAADADGCACCPYRVHPASAEEVPVFGEFGLAGLAVTNPAYRGAVNIVGRKPSAAEAVGSARFGGPGGGR
jgi:hypothetical protein